MGRGHWTLLHLSGQGSQFECANHAAGSFDGMDHAAEIFLVLFLVAFLVLGRCTFFEQANAAVRIIQAHRVKLRHLLRTEHPFKAGKDRGAQGAGFIRHIVKGGRRLAVLGEEIVHAQEANRFLILCAAACEAR